MNIWTVLGIEPTQDKKLIKRAYVTALKSCHPEDNPEGFMELREAYDRALSRMAYMAQIEWEHTDENEIIQEPQELDQPLDAEAPPPLTESPIVSEILDHLTDYSDLVIQNSQTENNSATYVDFEEEFHELLALLDNLLTNEKTLSDEKKWAELLGDPLIHNQYYKPIFCRNLIGKIREKLRLHLRNNHFTPQVVILIANFLQSTTDIGEQRILKNHEVLNISQLLTASKRYLKHEESSPQNPKIWLNKLKWLLFSYHGRLRRRTFFFTIIILYPLIFLTIQLSNESRRKEDPAPNPIVVASNDDLAHIDLDNMDQMEILNLDLKGKNLDSPEKNPDTLKKEPSTLGNVPLNFTFVVLFFWVTSALIIKRLNDTGKSPFLLFLIFVPYANLGILYVLIKNKDTDNQHGYSTQTEIKTLEKYRAFVYSKLVDSS